MSETVEGWDPAVFAEQAEVLKAVLKPYRAEWKRREKLSVFVEQCARAASRGDFFLIAELMETRPAAQVREEEELEGCEEALEVLAEAAGVAIERYRAQFVDDLLAEADAAGLELTVEFPAFRTLPGIEGTVDFSTRTVTINKTVVKSVEPKRIVAALAKVEKELYGRSFEPRGFVEELFAIYRVMVDEGKAKLGEGAPMADFYLRLVLSRQSEAFFLDLDKQGFRGYAVEELAVDLWRYAQLGSGKTSSGHVLRLRPGLDRALWLLDAEGARRQIAAIAFEAVG